MLPTFRLFVSVVFAVNLSADRVPSTITEPSKFSTTNELKSVACKEDAAITLSPVYTLVPALFAELSVTVILSFDTKSLSSEAAITALPIATASAFEKLLSAKLEAFVALICEVVLSSKVKILPPL